MSRHFPQQLGDRGRLAVPGRTFRKRLQDLDLDALGRPLIVHDRDAGGHHAVMLADHGRQTGTDANWHEARIVSADLKESVVFDDIGADARSERHAGRGAIVPRTLPAGSRLRLR